MVLRYHRIRQNPGTAEISIHRFDETEESIEVPLLVIVNTYEEMLLLGTICLQTVEFKSAIHAMPRQFTRILPAVPLGGCRTYVRLILNKPRNAQLIIIEKATVGRAQRIADALRPVQACNRVQRYGHTWPSENGRSLKKV